MLAANTGRVLTTFDAALTKIPIKRAALAHDCVLCGDKVVIKFMSVACNAALGLRGTHRFQQRSIHRAQFFLIKKSREISESTKSQPRCSDLLNLSSISDGSPTPNVGTAGRGHLADPKARCGRSKPRRKALFYPRLVSPPLCPHPPPRPGLRPCHSLVHRRC